MLTYEELDNSGKTTKYWRVSSSGTTLGYVFYYAPWRNYVYEQNDEVIMSTSCLREVADFCESESKKFRATWKKKKL